MTAAFTPLTTRRKAVNKTARVLLGTAAALAISPALLILWEVLKEGEGAIKGLDFFTQAPPGFVGAAGGGVANGIIGTLIMVGLALAVAVPLALLGAIYLVEFGRGSRMAAMVRFFADVMTGIPSIVFGIFVYIVLVISTGSFSALSGAVALGLIMWPVLLRASEEVLRLVPSGLREAAYALGVPKWRVVLKVVLPTAAGGLVTAVMLGTARGAGETAPLLFTALGSQFVSTKLTKPMSALPLEIFRGATTAFKAGNARAWAAAATLIGLILLLTVLGRVLTGRRRPSQP